MILCVLCNEILLFLKLKIFKSRECKYERTKIINQRIQPIMLVCGVKCDINYSMKVSSTSNFRLQFTKTFSTYIWYSHNLEQFFIELTKSRQHRKGSTLLCWVSFSSNLLLLPQIGRFETWWIRYWPTFS